MKSKAPVLFLINHIILLMHKLFCFLLVLQFLYKNFRLLIKEKTIVVSRLAELGDIIACLAIFDYLTDEIKGRSVFYFISIRIDLEFNENINHCKFNKEIAHSYYHWLLLSKVLSFFKKNRTIDLNLNGAWCHKTNKRYIMNGSGINENNYYLHGGLLTSAFKNPSFSNIENRDLSRSILKLEDFEDLVSIDKTKILVILHSQSRDVHRNWPIKNWKKILENFDPLKYQIFEIGIEQSFTSNNITFFPTNNLNQIFYLISKSNIFLGIDSSFAHVAEIFEIPSIIVIGNLKNFAYQVPYSSYYYMNKFKFLIRKNLPIQDITIREVKWKLDLVLDEIKKNKFIHNFS